MMCQYFFKNNDKYKVMQKFIIILPKNFIILLYNHLTIKVKILILTKRY